jgi:hypothetical protein
MTREPTVVRAAFDDETVQSQETRSLGRPFHR